ncbi:helicase-related protein [Trichothermofontia sp.]
MIYRFNEYLRKRNDDNNRFIASQDEIVELTDLALKLLDFSSSREDGGVENTKLTWLKEMLDEHPRSRFLVFTEILQTCEIITKALPRIADKLTGSMSASERERVVRKFRGVERSNMRVFVATSTADEDFQVANRVIHWDLSPSPAVLMQRNGRVARLGQISDVTAYYLIMEGTHEEQRGMALHQRFNDLGIQDEQLRLKILGSLTDEEEERLSTAVRDEGGRVLVVNEILASANQKKQEMNQKLGELQQTIQAQSVIDRTMLANRLKHWVELGLPPREENEFHFSFDIQEWERPIFSIDQETRMEYALAGLRPWVLKKKGHRDTEVWKHRPMDEDLIGELAGSIARWREADFTVINAEKLYPVLPKELHDVNYLLFATHPFLEVETHADGKILS